MKNEIANIDISNKIYTIRGQQVMLDRDLAALYMVKIKVLNQTVKRNIDRFPSSFMFQLTEEELNSLRFQNGILDNDGLRPQNGTFDSERLRSQFVTIKNGRGSHRKYLPYAFTEQGVAMLSSILKSERAIQVNVAIMRTFVHLRRLLASHADLTKRLDELERKYDTQFKVVFDAIRKLMVEPKKSKRRIGFFDIQGQSARRKFKC